jgi:DNA-binding transcriptional regulator YhcF (GntR family)
MSQPVPQNEPAAVPRDTYPMVRISSEFFLRGIDLLTHVQGDKLISGLVFMAVWHNHMEHPDDGAIGVRELARRLNLPYETVRRHARELARTGQCTATSEGIAAVPAVLRSRANVEVMRKIYFNAERMLVALTRAGLAKFRAPSAAPRRGKLTREQMTIATIATGRLLEGVRFIGDHWNGDVLRGLVFTAMWTANVKHVTNTAPAASQAVLSDDQRLPVSILAISNSLRLPYETVRRHALALEKAGISHRVGRQGMVVPASTHRKLASSAAQTHGLLTGFFADLRRAGVKA